MSAPYNFVPLSKHVVYPEWGLHVSHDVPFEDGISGQFVLRVTLQSPTCVRDSSSDAGAFFSLPKSHKDAPTKYAIPGTELRGMLRNVVQIASFSALTPYNDHRFAIRDLTNDLDYLDKLQGSAGSKVCAGWLEMDPGDRYDGPGQSNERRWQLHPCNFAKVRYEDIVAYASANGDPSYDPNRRQSAPEKYDRFHADVHVRAAVSVTQEHETEGRIGDAGEVTQLFAAGTGQGEAGTLVFTGQPQERRKGDKNKKRHDWFFYGGDYDVIDVPFEAVANFRFVHSSARTQRGGADARPNDEWGYWQKEFEKGARVPVFFLPSTNSVNQLDMGLASMFRLPYQHSVGDLVERQQTRDPSRLDFAELLFGRVVDADALPVLRGRVSIATAVACDEPKPVPGEEVSGILGAPKATFYPAYLVQGNYEEGRAGERAGRPNYNTYMNRNARIRGWKRYVQRDDVIALPQVQKKPGKEDNDRVITRFCPLAPGAQFESNVRVHNLRPAEIGALLWAIDFGGDATCRHAMGTGRAYGYGVVKLSIERIALRQPPSTQNSVSASELLDYCRQSFGDYMEDRLYEEDGWACSEQVLALKALARPVDPAKAEQHRPMTLNHADFGNEFTAVKRSGLALRATVQQTEVQAARQELLRERTERVEIIRAQRAEKEAADRAEQRALMSAEELAIAQLGDARRDNAHLTLLRQWLSESNSREELLDARRNAASEVIGRPSKQWRKRNADIWEWMSVS